MRKERERAFFPSSPFRNFFFKCSRISEVRGIKANKNLNLDFIALAFLYHFLGHSAKDGGLRNGFDFEDFADGYCLAFIAQSEAAELRRFVEGSDHDRLRNLCIV